MVTAARIPGHVPLWTPDGHWVQSTQWQPSGGLGVPGTPHRAGGPAVHQASRGPGCAFHFQADGDAWRWKEGLPGPPLHSRNYLNSWAPLGGRVAGSVVGGRAVRWGADTIGVIPEVKGSQSSADLGFCCGDGVQTFQFLIRLNVGQRWSRGPQEGAGLEWEPNETPENSGGRLL